MHIYIWKKKEKKETIHKIIKATAEYAIQYLNQSIKQKKQTNAHKEM